MGRFPRTAMLALAGAVGRYHENWAFAAMAGTRERMSAAMPRTNGKKGHPVGAGMSGHDEREHRRRQAAHQHVRRPQAAVGEHEVEEKATPAGRKHAKAVGGLGVALLVLTTPVHLDAQDPPGPSGETFEALLRRAEQGDADAQARLGSMYNIGLRVPEDDAEAVRWFRMAAEQGHVRGQVSLGVSYAYGAGVPEDDAEAVRWWRMAARQGDVEAQLRLGAAYANGEGVPKNDAEAARWRRMAAEQAEQGDVDAQLRLGAAYANGLLVPRDDAEAVRWFRMAAEQGHAEAQSILGDRYASGRGVPQDATEAARWYRRAAEQGFVGAQYDLGIMYANGEGVPRDFVLAHMWFNVAVANGDGQARRVRERLEWRMTPEDIGRATDLARLCFASSYRECGP